MTDKEAMKLALDALTYKKWFCLGMGKPNDPRLEAAITALKAQLAEHAMCKVQRLGQEIEQEPVACVADIDRLQRQMFLDLGYSLSDPLYAIPPQRTEEKNT